MTEEASSGVEQGVPSVEEIVRARLGEALGGKRGMLEAAIPTATFTILFVVTHHLWLAIGVSVVPVVALTALRLAHRSTAQFAFNGLVGIGVGALFAWRSGEHGGSVGDQALAYFLPGILYNAAQAGVYVLSVLVGWPLVGFLIGAVAGELTRWRQDRHVVRLCSRITLLLAAPCAIRAAFQGVVYIAGKHGWMPVNDAVAVLGAVHLALGWPLLLAFVGVIGWLLAQESTPPRDQQLSSLSA